MNTTTSIPNGTYNILAKATDKAGNIGVDATSNELIVNKPAPEPEPEPERDLVEYTPPTVGRGSAEEIKQTMTVVVKKQPPKTEKKEEVKVAKEKSKFAFVYEKELEDGGGQVLGVSEVSLDNQKNNIYNVAGIFMFSSAFLTLSGLFIYHWWDKRFNL